MSLEKYRELSHTYDRFSFESYKAEMMDDQLMLYFQYKLLASSDSALEDISFFHRVSYEYKGEGCLNTEILPKLDALIFSIGLVEGINYYKTVCPPIFEIKCGRLNQEQKVWWQKLYYHGLGELIYLNGMAEAVDQATFVRFIDDDAFPNPFEEVNLDLKGNLIPVGGGKDSVVTLEMLTPEKEDNLCFVMAPPQAAYDCIRVAGYEDYLLAMRYFDKQMLTMNQKGFINGHVPFSAILGFISLLGAALTGKQYIPLSNERSANEATVHGESYNHQYSKSYEFETDFNTYVNTYLMPTAKYFSLLRPLYELEIAELFAGYKAYHPVFRSCNRGKKANTWCGVCSKCLFVYIMLRPFLSIEEIIEIYGYDLLDNPDLEPIFMELVGKTPVKPFECVGTVEEVRVAMKMMIQKQEGTMPYLAQIFMEQIPLDTIGELDKTPQPHHIPACYQGRL